MKVDEIKKYLLAGKAVFTVESTKLEKRYTYRIKRDIRNNDRFYCEVLYGPDNTRDYRFLGWFYRQDFDLKHSMNSCTDQRDIRFKMLRAFLWFAYSGEFPETCVLHPSDRCARCGRLLTTPESIERGLGPECYERSR